MLTESSGDVKLKPCQTAMPTLNSVTECRVIVLFGAEGVVTAALEQACTGRLPSCQAAPRDYTVEENLNSVGLYGLCASSQRLNNKQPFSISVHLHTAAGTLGDVICIVLYIHVQSRAVQCDQNLISHETSSTSESGYSTLLSCVLAIESLRTVRGDSGEGGKRG